MRRDSHRSTSSGGLWHHRLSLFPILWDWVTSRTAVPPSDFSSIVSFSNVENDSRVPNLVQQCLPCPLRSPSQQHNMVNSYNTVISDPRKEAASPPLAPPSASGNFFRQPPISGRVCVCVCVRVLVCAVTIETLEIIDRPLNLQLESLCGPWTTFVPNLFCFRFVLKRRNQQENLGGGLAPLQFKFYTRNETTRSRDCTTRVRHTNFSVNLEKLSKSKLSTTKR